MSYLYHFLLIINTSPWLEREKERRSSLSDLEGVEEYASFFVLSLFKRPPVATICLTLLRSLFDNHLDIKGMLIRLILYATEKEGVRRGVETECID